MAEKRLSELSNASALDGTETFPIVQGAATKKIAAKDVVKFGYQDIANDPSTAKTLALTDLGAWIRCTAANAAAYTVPLNATVAFKIGETLNGIQVAAGQVGFVAEGAVVINKPTGYNAKTRAKGSAWSLVKVAENEWDLVGDLEATA